jgi:glycosyltransferase involved in cell wall biosynthesis
MKIQKNKILSTVIIVNYNNEKYINKCVNSVLEQTNANNEIIFVDDKSTDNSLKIIKKYKNKITILKNHSRNKSKHGSYNQINSYYRGFLKSKGKYIFFLDSDDYFKKNKLKKVINYFEKNLDANVVFDLAILKYKKKALKLDFKQKKFILSSWPRFTSQSCITVKRSFMLEIFKFLKLKKFEFIWLDFRIACYCYFKEKKINILPLYLTYYRQLEDSASFKFKTFSHNWWIRRNQAHDFVTYLSKKLKFKDKFTIDKFFTKLIRSFR